MASNRKALWFILSGLLKPVFCKHYHKAIWNNIQKFNISGIRNKQHIKCHSSNKNNKITVKVIKFVVYVKYINLNIYYQLVDWDRIVCNPCYRERFLKMFITT